MKRTVSLLALLAALCCLFTVSAAAADAPTSGTCGANLTWALDTTGTLTISGTGAMEEYEWESRVPWYQNRDSIKAVVIEQGVTGIGSHAFGLNYRNIVRITIPESVTSIGADAFFNCNNLTDVSITDLAAWCRIDFANSAATPMCNGGNIWLNDQKILSVEVPEDVTELNYTFCGFKDLIAVTLPDGLTTVGDYAFSGCENLTGIAIPKSVTAIGSSAFNRCIRLASITMQKGVTAIGNRAFSGCSSLISIKLPEGVTAIGDYAFSSCSSLNRMKLPEGVVTIGQDAFGFCTNLSSVTIPSSVTVIGRDAFDRCEKLTEVSISDLDAWCRIDFANHYATPMYYAKNIQLNGNEIVSAIVPKDVTALNYTFCGFKDLTAVTLPEGLTTIGDYAFYNCNSLTDITIPESVTAIGRYAFYCCRMLKSINIPKGVTAIGYFAFDSCSSLKDVYITDLAAWCSISFGNVTANPLYAYAENLYLNGALAETLEIPEGVTVIREGLFRKASCIQRVALPKSLTGVVNNAFAYCKNIQEVFYAGSEEEWSELTIAPGNDPLKNAQVYFNSTLDDYYCRISVQVSSGGRVTVDHAAARAGDTVTVTAAPYQGYELTAICVDGAAIEGNTFTVTGNHVVSARFTRVPVVGGTEDFRLEGLSVRTAAGEELQELPQGSLLVTVAVRHLNESGSGTILLAQYDSQGRYRGLMWLTLDEMPQGMTLRVTLPVDNSSGEIANLKVFVVEDLTSPLPVGTPVSFGQV